MDRTKPNLLQKLYSREIHGSFIRGHSIIHNKALALFSSIPDRLMFYLKDVLQHMGNHVMVGTTRCGQFLLTYSYATDIRHSVHMSYKYRLHWWVFRPSAPACKVAEVQLFDNQDIKDTLTVGIAQWPNVNDKLIVYGYNDDSYAAYEKEDYDVESRRYYITVTTLPSLHDCRDCKAVAESFDEEDMAANWDSCICMSCLKHGLTIHTTLDIAPPYPSFDFLTNLKLDNKIIVNTGNFLHVLSFGSDKEEIRSSQDDTIVPAEICHNIGEKLALDVKDYICPWKADRSSGLKTRRSLTRSVNKAWLNTIMDQAEKLYAFEESEDGCEPRFKWYRKRRLADKMYEFCSSDDDDDDDEDMENIRPLEKKLPRYFGSSTYFTGGQRKTVKDRFKDESNKDEFERWRSPTVIVKTDDEKWKENIILTEEPKYFVESLRAKKLEIESKRRQEQMDLQSKLVLPSNSSRDCDEHSEGNRGCEGECRTRPTLLVKTDLDIKDNIILSEEPKHFNEAPRAKKLEIESKRRREQLEKQNKTVVPSKTSCDCDESNVCDTQLSKRLDKASCRLCEESHKKTAVPQQNVVDNVSCKRDCDIFNKINVKELHNTPVSSTSKVDPLPSKSDFYKIPPLDMSIINPDLSAILAEWEADSVSSLSPKSDSFLYKNGETKNDVIQAFLELIPGITISPRSSNSGVRNSDHTRTELSDNSGPWISDNPHSTNRMSSPNSPLTCKYSPLLVVLRTRNCNQDKEQQRSKEQDDRCKGFTKEEVAVRVKPGNSVKTGKDADLTMRQRMISGCSVRFDRIYIEVDEEIISTITDIEDDDPTGSGFHCALPLSVHGSAYAQLQMVSSHKAEKMNIHCERVYQTTLDIEQFCFKAADIICKCEGFKFWFCNDYDVEIIDVCAISGDILGVVCLRLNAEKKSPKSERHTILNQRYFYEVRCVFIWNPGNDRCWLEAYSNFVDVTKYVHSHWAPAKQEAIKLRAALQSSTLFSLNPHPPIRTFAHRLWHNDNLVGASLEEIRDHSNLIGFRLLRVPRHRRRIVDFL